MRATIELANELTKFPEINLINNVYADSVPPESIDSVNQTTLLITEAISTLDGYGNNTFNEINQTLKLTIYYGLEFDDDIQVFEILLYKFLESINWRVDGIQPTYFDEDTNQAVRVFNVNCIKAIEV